MNRPDTRLFLVDEAAPERDPARDRAREAADRPLPIAALTLAGIVTGNALAFAWDPHGALVALAATIGVSL